MRYIVEKCCDSEIHITNKASGSYGKMMGSVLAEMGEWLKDLAFTRRIRNFVVMCPNELLGEDETIKAGSRKVTSFWKESAVHLTQDGYTALAESILEKLSATTLLRKVDEDKLVVCYAGKDKLVDRTAHRPKWVTGNDSAVNRRYDVEDNLSCGRGRGGRMARGGRGGHGGHKHTGGPNKKPYRGQYRKRPY
jgi:hypothetical protein